MRRLFDAVAEEMQEALAKNRPFASAHEGYAILLEEVDELWDEVKKKSSKRDTVNMTKECIQIAACALRFALDICKAGENK